MSDWWESAEGRRYMRRANDELMPMVRDSSVTMSLWTGKVDPKMALEMGYMVLLDKPIIAVVEPGVKVPRKLAAVVDEFVEGHPGDPGFAERLAAAMKRLGVER